MTAATIETDNTEAVTKANVDTLNGFTTGVVTVKSVRDTRANVEAIDAIDDGEVLMNTAIVSVTDAVTKTQADSLNLLTAGQVTLESVEDTNANILLIDGLTTSEVTMAAAAVKVTDKVNNAEVDTLNSKTTGKVTVDILSLIHI